MNLYEFREQLRESAYSHARTLDDIEISVVNEMLTCDDVFKMSELLIQYRVLIQQQSVVEKIIEELGED